ncbi:putative nuclear migration protein (ApsA) [Aspergillus homomorphus CBS 101889]|uniref:Anucleate primary sterigmata protein A n=1 Tax=Aspergillus homomorphus (strain CBS 101889) TaxID=1450537 RepID=A0A395HJI9_ASPHC|nr:anucleate primary sterigmata protein A [Aspergillus homomorphus CBS 101889]RAL07987.1 anucleate primary sterigmata protein A [Aspergillus homomorphus CBS 101889]
MSTAEDPFVSPSGERTASRDSHKYSSFDTQLFSLNASSPAQAKRALEAHLAETERRLEEAGKLGTTLIEQQRQLEEKLREVEQQQDEGQIGPDLRRKLADLEREYNEIGRESARAFLAPKRLASGEDGHLGTPYEQKSPISSALFAGQATNSPSKVSVPSRKQRNQPSNRVHDIEFATEISTSLLAQVRQLQTLLAEREEALKAVNLEKSRLELEAEGYAQRIRVLDESEERYKDENWALETRTHELLTAAKEAADRESRLNSSLGALATEKSAMERELEDLRHANAKLVEDHTAAQKANDAEIHLLRRNLHAGDTEKLALQKKVEELNSQNEELAKAVAMRLRQQEHELSREVHRDQDSDDQDQSTPENSPPPSPNRFTPRHNHLETETLKSSLGHAHRMIQNLKSTIHREKTEKIDLKRMLQEARDEIEQKRREAVAPTGPSSKRQKTKPDPARKAARPDLLGAGRKRAEIEIHESDWEDNATDASPSHKATLKASRARMGGPSSEEPSDAYQTATEADDNFETATERGTATESEAFQTGLESMADDSTDSGELTETDNRLQRTPRGRVSSFTMTKTRDRKAYESTASNSSDEDAIDEEGFPSPSQVSPRYRVRNKRSIVRRIRPSGEAPMASNSRPSTARESPATSFMQSPESTEGQSLFMELADLDGDDDQEGDFGPPMRFDTASQASTPRMLPAYDSRRPSEAVLDTVPEPVMVDAGMMTEPWEPAVPAAVTAVPLSEETVNGEHVLPSKPTMSDAGTATEQEQAPEVVHASTQWNLPASEAVVAETQREVQQPSTQLNLEFSSVAAQETIPSPPRHPQLNTAYAVGVTTEPIASVVPAPPDVALSLISSAYTEPVTASLPQPAPVYVPNVAVSTISFQHTPPIVAALPEPAPVATLAEHGTNTETRELAVSSIYSLETEPVAASPKPTPVPVIIEKRVEVERELPMLTLSSIVAQQTEPVLATTERSVDLEHESVVESAKKPELPELAASSIFSQQTEPVLARDAAEPKLLDLNVSVISSECTEPAAPQLHEVPIAPASQISLSDVRAVETIPVKHVPSAIVVPPVQLTHGNTPSAHSMHMVKGLPASELPLLVVNDDGPEKNAASGTNGTTPDPTLPLSTISGNAVPRQTRQQSVGRAERADQGAQTILSSKQIDQILMDRVTTRPLSPPDSDKAKEQNTSPFATPRARTRPTHQSSQSSLPSHQLRPGSSLSHTSSIQSHPPLPTDHKEAIMAAEKRSLDQQPSSPALMGPPLAPASAHRTNVGQRPRTPNESGLQVNSTSTTTSRVKLRNESNSHISRRSSVSSFASEIDERFAAQPIGPQGYAAGTDPRMIQAITQTMIGEFLWKYTRKTVTGEVSSTRHRRYFWVHPYTRTLYWSAQDPQTAGTRELKTKSVPIEAVRVVPDDNPYPPGLHCRSLEVVSPGRRVRFTATTSQRHETWFNALSYLLLRNSAENGEEQESNASLQDIDEFNPEFHSRSRQTSRLSFSSSRSRTARNWPKERAGSTISSRRTLTPGRGSPSLAAPAPFTEQRNGSSSRLSTILNTTIKGSFGRKGPRYASSSVHEGSVHTRDSHDDFRHTMERQESQGDRLENVRACCDGKHDVSALSRTSKYSPRVNRIHSHH